MNQAKWITTLLFSLCALFCAWARDESGTNAYRDLTFTQFFQRSSRWVAGDGAWSVPLNDGRVLWLFGDSHIDDLDAKTGTMACLFQARNAALLQKKKTSMEAVTLVGKGPGFRSWLKTSDDGGKEWLWPMNGFQERQTVWIYTSALRRTPSGGQWGFESIGHDYWARIQWPEMVPKGYTPLPSFNGINFGCGFVKEGEFYYAFGAKKNHLASDVYAARFKVKDPGANWEFWDGKQWNSRVTDAFIIARGASTSVHVCKVKNKYLLTTSQFSVACDQGKAILMATSPAPFGPYTSLKSIYTIDDLYEGHLPFFYLPMAHPEFLDSKEELLVTYSINNYEPCIEACLKDRSIPNHYRPKAIRVPLGLIDPELQ